jgi:hypothetical protein
VGDFGGIDTQLPGCLCCGLIILSIDRIRKQKLSFALRAINLDWHGDGRANENALRTLLGDHQAALFNAELAA